MYSTQRERIVFLMCALGVMFFLPITATAAELQLSPAAGSYAVGKEFAIKVAVTPGGESVNAADGTITFDSSILSVSKISKDGSAFSLWTAEPTFSNSAGTITFSGGTPTAFTANADVLTITFKGKAPGTATLSFSKGSILAADGKGTDVYSKGADASVTITEAAGAEESGSESSGEEEAKPIIPVITSQSHPKEDAWYATSSVVFSWKVAPDVTEIRVGISNADDAKPDTTLKPEATSHTFTDVADGVWYVFAQFKNEFGIGEIAKKKIQIDTVPPDEFDFKLSEGDSPQFTFAALDSLSGIDRYEVKFGDTTVATVRVQDAAEASTPVPPQEGGAQRVTVRAIDKAGNIREKVKELTLPAVAKQSAKKEGDTAEEAGFITVERVLLLLFAMALGGLVTLNISSRKNVQQEKVRILHEVALVRDKNDKVFSAMREEFEQMVNDLNPQPQLTPQERDFLEKIKEALDISEEVVDTSMEELKKTIRG